MQGIKIYQINQENADSIIPQLQYDITKKQMFRDLINSGKEITVPEENVTISSWTGTGYVAQNPDDGTGVYMIYGGLSGGRTDLEIDWWGIFVDALIQIISNLHEMATYTGYTYTVIDSWLAIWDFQYIGLGLVNSEVADLLYNLQAACAFLNLISASTAVLAVLGGAGVSVGFAIGIGISVFLIVQLLTIIRLTLYEIYFSQSSFIYNKKLYYVKVGVYSERYI